VNGSDTSSPPPPEPRPERGVAPRGGFGLPPVVIRGSNVRALAGLSLAIVLRLLREGLVVRALVWPGLLTAMSMFISASVTIAWRNNPVIYVSDAALVQPLEAADFKVRVHPDPEATLRDGTSERAVWREGEKLVMGVTWGGILSTKAESVLRNHVEERWRLEVPSPQKRRRDSVELRPVTGLLAGVVALLFTLYGVVIGAGSLYRDRSSGVLESDLALPVPRWIHAAARLVALSAVLGPALIVSLFIVDTLLPIFKLYQWMFTGILAALTGGMLGVASMARNANRRGFSAALSQSLTITMGLIALGFAAPVVGRAFPLVSLGSSFAGGQASLWSVPVAILAAALVSADFHRRECV
jgi:hypothetical protein